MGLTDRLRVAIEAAGTALGVLSPPDADPDRLARVDELTAAFRVEGAREVAAEAVLAELAAGRPLVLVDARSEAERAVSTLPDAVAAEVVAAEPGAWADRPLVVYCTIGHRSGRWAAAHPDLDVRNLSGGVLAWAHAGGGFVDAAGAPSTTVHVWGAGWDLLPAGFTAVW